MNLGSTVGCVLLPLLAWENQQNFFTAENAEIAEEIREIYSIAP
jgi:hypothetical protein